MMYYRASHSQYGTLKLCFQQIVAKRALPEAIRHDLASYVGCISGAIDVDTYKALLTDAGLTGERSSQYNIASDYLTLVRCGIRRHSG